MLNLKYLGSNDVYQVSFKSNGNSIVTIIGDMPIKKTGFCLYKLNNDKRILGDYSSFTTVYKELENGVMFSNDGSVYVEPLSVVNFTTNKGGTLEGKTSQEVYNYEELTVPTPIADEYYGFSHWNPEIPEEGKVETLHKTFTATFESILPEPNTERYEELLKEKIAELDATCESLINNGVVVNGEHYTYYSNDRTDLKELFDTVSITGLPIGYDNADGVCREHTAEEIITIYMTQLLNKYSQETYKNQAVLYLKKVNDANAIINFNYGAELTGEYLEHYNEMLKLYQAQLEALVKE